MTAREYLLAVQDQAGGAIPFHRYMQDALYHPDFGYYAANIREVGRRGDFATWPTLHPSLARAVAAWIGKARDVIEVGAGNGEMARAILECVGWFGRRRLRYHIVEASPTLRNAQASRLRGSGVRWHEDVAAALRETGGCAHIFSNELVDAFPCRVFERGEYGWHELALRVEDARIAEVLLSVTTLPDSSLFAESAKQGSRVEVHDSYRSWLAMWAGGWRSGSLLTIDYGGTMPALTHRRPRGSLRAYAHHQRLCGQDVYGGFGKRDITADVNFSDLDAWGRSLGWDTQRLTTLREWLSPAVAVPDAFSGAAEAFYVLIQTPGIPVTSEKLALTVRGEENILSA